jgi:hypothetical protein
VNDAAGLPIIEVESNLTDKITMGTYGSNALVINDNKVGIGTSTPSGKLEVIGDTRISGNLSFPNTGVAQIASTGSLSINVGGSQRLNFTPAGFINAGTSKLYGNNWGAGYHADSLTANIYEFCTSVDNVNVVLTSDSGNVLAQRNGINHQESRIYGTYTNATNFERLNLKYNSTNSAFQIGTEKGTSGTARPLQLQTDNVTRMTLSTGGNVGIGTTTPDTKLYVVGKLAVNSSVLGGKALDVYTAEAGSAAVIQTNGLTNGDGILQLVSPSSSGVAYALRGSVQSNGAGLITIQQNGVGDAVLEALSISAGDSMSRYLINGGASYSVGIDNSDADKFKISNSSNLGTNDRLVIDASGSIGIGTATPSDKLHVIGNIKAVGILNNDGITDSTFKRIINPGGGTYITTASTVTGAITITLPVGMTNTMLRMTIKIYEYATGRSFEIHCGGYNYLAGPNAWFNTFAYTIGQPDSPRNLTARFGYTSGGKSIVYIGELASTWSIPQVFITEVQCGYAGLSQDFTSGWTVGFTTAAFENVTQTNSNIQIGQLSTTTPAALGTAAVGTSTTVARADHVHAAPTTLGSLTIASGLLVQNGNVGIGTSNPGNMLHLFSAASSTIRLGTTNYTYQVGPLADDGVFHIKRIDGVVSDRLVINANGNVGIGTTTPSARLHIAGGDTSLAFTGASLALGFGSTGTYPHFIHTRHNAGTPVSNAIDFYTSNGTEAGVYPSHAIHALTLTNSNVGIGTTTPSSKLDILDTTLAVGSGQTGSALNIQQSWNTNAYPIAIKLNVTDTSSPGGTQLLALKVNNTDRFSVNKEGLAYSYGYAVVNAGGVNVLQAVNAANYGYHMSKDYCVTWGSNATLNGSIDLSLSRDNTGILAQKNGLNPQAYRLYNTYTSDTNFERLNFRWDSSVAKIGTSQGASSGLARDLVLETSGTERVRITASGLFSADGVSFGKGRAGIASNIAIGQSSLVKNISGSYNLAIGRNSLAENTNGDFNVAIGEASLRYSTVGSNNIAIGQNALINNIASSYNVAIGQNTFSNLFIGAQNVSIGQSSLGGATEADNNVAIGYNAGLYDASLSDLVELTYNSVFIGANASALGAFGDTNSIAIGYSARGMGSNTAVFGNDGITDTYLKGVVQIPRFATSPYDSERIAMRWNGLTATIGTSKLGTGLARPLAFETNGVARMTIATGGNVSNSALFSTSGFAYTGIVPATTGAPGVSGEMAFSANFLYRHNGTNWQRTGIGFANW